MKLEELLANYRPGSQNWSWAEESADLVERDLEALKALRTSIAEQGMLEPLLLGTDGRVWDGHHRIVVAMRLALEDVPVQLAGYWRNGRPQRSFPQWRDRALPTEIGDRAYRHLVLGNRDSATDGQMAVRLPSK